MEPVFSMSALQRNPSLVLQAAREGVVRVTEKGAPAYVLCAEDVFEERISRERADAAYEARMLGAVARGIADIEAGRCYTSVEEAFSRADEVRRRHP